MRVTCHAEGCCRRRPAVVARWIWPTAIQRSWLPDLPALIASVTQARDTCTCQEHRGGIDWQEHGPYLCHAFSQGVGSGLASVVREGACARPPRLAQPPSLFRAGRPRPWTRHGGTGTSQMPQVWFRRGQPQSVWRGQLQTTGRCLARVSGMDPGHSLLVHMHTLSVCCRDAGLGHPWGSASPSLAEAVPPEVLARL